MRTYGGDVMMLLLKEYLLSGLSAVNVLGTYHTN